MQVYAQLISSYTGQLIARQPQLLTLAQEMLASVTVYEPKISIEHNMGRVVGYSFTIATNEKDAVFYGQILKDTIYTRFVKNGKPVPTNYLTVSLHKERETVYELSDIWIGRLIPARPGTDKETAQSKSYWSNHAVILDGQRIQQHTITKTCPY